MLVPQHLREGLAQASGSAFLNDRRRHLNAPSGDHLRVEEEYTEVSCDLPLQMLLYFDMLFFPFWCISEVVMLDLKFSLLPAHYQCLTVTGMVLISIFQVIRAYLGYTGNLKEKVPELAGFWLISVLLQLPLLLFFLTDEGLVILPLEWAVHSVYLPLLLGEVLFSVVALRRTSRRLALRFHQGHPVSGHLTGPWLFTGATTHGTRAVLPMMPVRDVRARCRE